LWASSGLSNLADGGLQLSLPLIALELTGSPSAVAGVSVAMGLPWLLFALHAGALADRLDRRNLMVAVQLGRVAAVGTLAVVLASGTEGLWMLYSAAFVLGVLETLFDTAAQSIMPSIVAPSDLTRANGRLYAVETTMNEFVGPPLGGVLVGFGIALSLGTTAVFFLLAAVTLAAVPGSFRHAPATPATRLREDIAEGLRFLWQHRLLRRFTLIAGLSNICTLAAFALLPALVVRPGPMGLSEVGFGLLLAASAVGSLVASLTVEAIERSVGRRRLLLVCIIVDGGAIASWATADVIVAVPAGIVLGAGMLCWNVVVVSLRQRIVPGHLLGRVNAASRMVSWGAMPLGAALGASLVRIVEVRTVFALSGGAIVLLAVLARGITDERMADAEQRALAASPA
jgi:MFS family permease